MLRSMQAKKCTGCETIKDIYEFALQPRGLFGRRSKCKSCMNIYNKNYISNRMKCDSVFRAKKLKQALDWSIKNPEKRAIIAKKRNQKERKNNPDKIKARSLVNHRVRFGRMAKASSLKCVKCNLSAKHYHHHNGYSFEFRYDVVPVCVKCHVIMG